MDPLADATSALQCWEMVGERAVGRFFFSSRLPLFGGHFPEHPLLPGVHQLAAWIVLARLGWKTPSAQLTGITRTKWLAPIAPEVAFVAEVTRTSPHHFSGLITADGRRSATGQITLHPITA